VSAAVTALYRARLAAVTGQALGRVRTLWLQQFDPADALATIGLAGRAAGTWIPVAQETAAAEAAAYLEALLAEATGVPVGEVAPFAVPPVAGTSAAGVPVADLTGLAPGVYAARTAAGAPPEVAARAAAEWLNRLSASEPFRAANATVLHGAATDDRLTGRAVRVTRPSACEFCRLIADRGYIPANAGFQAHAHCVPGQTLVRGPLAEAGFRRVGHGEIVIARTAGGHQLAITPNHPVLTDRGWVAAGLLREGVNVVCGGRGQRLAARVPDVQEMPARAEQVWDAMAVSGAVVMPVSPEDFHADAAAGDGQVEVVLADGQLRSDLQTALGQPRCERGLAWRGGRRLVLAGQRTAGKASVRAPLAPDSGVGGGGQGGAFPGGHLCRAYPHGIAGAADLGALAEQVACDHRARYAEPPGDREHRLARAVPLEGVSGQGYAEGARPARVKFDAAGMQGGRHDRGVDADLGRSLLDRLAGAVYLDRVTETSRVYGAHVLYNFQTAEGWYEADGIIVSNCRCTASPEISSRVYSRAAQRRAARAYAVRVPAPRAALRSGHDHPERATTATGPAPGPGATGPAPGPAEPRAACR
jgi:hypothetical protein